MINFAGTAYSYAKAIQAQYKVNKKMDEFTGKRQSPFSAASLSFAVGMKVSSTDGLSGINGVDAQEVDYRLSDIIIKLRSGKRLGGSDLEYLRKKNPQLYQKALDIERERQEYEQELKKCRTKEDARRVNAIKNQSLLCAAKKAEAANDLGAALDVEMRVNAINDSHQSFVKSEAYKRLPEDYKEIADKSEKRERARGARRKEEPRSEEATEPPKATEPPEATEPENAPEPPEATEPENAPEPEAFEEVLEQEPALEPMPVSAEDTNAGKKRPAKKREKK